MEAADKQRMMDIVDPMGLLGMYFDEPLDWQEEPYLSPERGRLEGQMAALRDMDRANPEQLQLRHALQGQVRSVPGGQDAREASQILAALAQGQGQAFEKGASAISSREQAAQDALARVLWDQKRQSSLEASGRAARIRGAKTYDRNFQANNLAKALQSGAVMGVTLADVFGDHGSLDIPTGGAARRRSSSRSAGLNDTMDLPDLRQGSPNRQLIPGDDYVPQEGGREF